LSEIVRVLRPGGTLGVLWNRIRGDETWVQEIAQIMSANRSRDDSDPPWTGHPDLSDPTCRTFTHGQELDAEALFDNVRSRSVVIIKTAAEREQVLERVRQLAPPGRFRLPLICFAWRSRYHDVLAPC